MLEVHDKVRDESFSPDHWDSTPASAVLSAAVRVPPKNSANVWACYMSYDIRAFVEALA